MSGPGDLPHRPAPDRRLVVVTVEADQAEVASFALWQAGAAGIEEREAGDGRVALVTSLALGVVEAALAGVTAGGRLHRGATAEEVAEPEHWEGEWLRWVPVTTVGRLTIRPPWSPSGGPEAPTLAGAHASTFPPIELLIDPTGAFGSGAHPTTRLALAQLLDLPLHGLAVLDIGCGTGVLSVAAAALGASAVVGVDIDPEAVAATTANAGRNGVGTVVTALDTPLEALAAGFDVVLANLLLPTHLELCGHYRRLAPGGRLVASGVLDEQVGGFLSALGSPGVTGRCSAAGWAGLCLDLGG